MTPAKKILSMIESVDPADTAKLDEIDARVWCYLEGMEFKEYFSNFNTSDRHAFSLDYGDILLTPNYTRSRDALKAIRPEGWIFDIEWWGRSNIEYSVRMYKSDKIQFMSPIICSELYSEELAELHAIIQAIEFEKNK